MYKNRLEISFYRGTPVTAGSAVSSAGHCMKTVKSSLSPTFKVHRELKLDEIKQVNDRTYEPMATVFFPFAAGA